MRFIVASLFGTALLLGLPVAATDAAAQMAKAPMSKAKAKPTYTTTSTIVRKGKKARKCASLDTGYAAPTTA